MKFEVACMLIEMENDFQIKEITAKERVTFQSEGNKHNFNKHST